MTPEFACQRSLRQPCAEACLGQQLAKLPILAAERRLRHLGSLQSRIGISQIGICFCGPWQPLQLLLLAAAAALIGLKTHRICRKVPCRQGVWRATVALPCG